MHVKPSLRRQWVCASCNFAPCVILTQLCETDECEGVRDINNNERILIPFSEHKPLLHHISKEKHLETNSNYFRAAEVFSEPVERYFCSNEDMK